MNCRYLKCYLGIILGLALSFTSLPGYIHAADNTTQPTESVFIPQMSGPFYLALNLPKSRFYLGEKTSIQLVLYINSNYVNNVEINKPILTQAQFKMDFLGSYVRNLEMNNDPIKAITFTYSFTPLQTGKFNLGPFKFNFPAVINDAYSRKVNMEVVSSKANINVLPLPVKGRPVDYSGGVGSFQLAVNAASYQVLQGEPIKVTLKVYGAGDLSTVSPPVLKSETGLKVFGAQKRADLSSNNGTSGQTVFEQVLIPTDPKVKQIAPYQFSFFNPNSGTYQTIRSAAIGIAVKPNPNFKNNPADSETQKTIQLAPLKASLGIYWNRNNIVIILSCLLLVNFLALLTLLWAVFCRRRHDLLQSDTPKARAIRAAAKAEAQLSSTKTRLNDQNTDEIMDNLHLILREFLGERFNLAVAGMTSTITHTLTKHGLSKEILNEIKQFFERYDQHNFAGTRITAAEAEKIQEQVEKIISIINKLDIK